jgi:hypothetical protein
MVWMHGDCNHQRKPRKTICTVMLVQLSRVVEIHVRQGRLPCNVTLAVLSMSREDQLFAVFCSCLAWMKVVF